MAQTRLMNTQLLEAALEMWRSCSEHHVNRKHQPWALIMCLGLPIVTTLGQISPLSPNAGETVRVEINATDPRMVQAPTV